MHPHYHMAHGLLGWAYAQNGQFREALSEFRKAQAAADEPGNRVGIGYVAALDNNMVEARQTLSELKNALHHAIRLAASFRRDVCRTRRSRSGLRVLGEGVRNSRRPIKLAEDGSAFPQPARRSPLSRPCETPRTSLTRWVSSPRVKAHNPRLSGACGPRGGVERVERARRRGHGR